MTVSSELWQANQDLAQACQSLSQTLLMPYTSQEKFAYLCGTRLFLEARRAYSIAAKATDCEGFGTFHALTGGVLEEIHLHEGYAAAWGVNLLC